jgi:hypothetical protein
MMGWFDRGGPVWGLWTRFERTGFECDYQSLCAWVVADLGHGLQVCSEPSMAFPEAVRRCKSDLAVETGISKLLSQRAARLERYANSCCQGFCLPENSAISIGKPQ